MKYIPGGYFGHRYSIQQRGAWLGKYPKRHTGLISGFYWCVCLSTNRRTLIPGVPGGSFNEY